MLTRLANRIVDAAVPVLLASVVVLGVALCGFFACGLVALSSRVLVWGFGGR